MTICPKCLAGLEDYTELEGGWCRKCEDWFPPDIVREFLEQLNEE